MNETDAPTYDEGEPSDARVRSILDEAHRVWFGIERGTHTASHLDQVLDPRRWATEREPTDAHVLAALNRYYVPDGKHAENLSDWSEGSVRAMRAVLRDAFEADDEGVR